MKRRGNPAHRAVHESAVATNEVAGLLGQSKLMQAGRADVARVRERTRRRDLLVTDDAGDSWRKFAREFGEVHALAWVPN